MRIDLSWKEGAVEDLRQAVRNLQLRAIMSCRCGVETPIAACREGSCGCGACRITMLIRLFEKRLKQPLTERRFELRCEELASLEAELHRYHQQRRNSEAELARQNFRVISGARSPRSAQSEENRND